MAFQEAEITDTDRKQDITSLTTDDLVLWLGEKFIENKQQTKILNLQKKKIVELETQLLKSQSIKVSADQVSNDLKAQHEKTIADLKLQYEQVIIKLKSDLGAHYGNEIVSYQAQIKDLGAQLSKLQSSKHEYAISLENKVHEIALERDESKKEISTLKTEVEAMKHENERLMNLTPLDLIRGKKKRS